MEKYELEKYELIKIRNGKRHKVCELQETAPKTWTFRAEYDELPYFDLDDTEVTEHLGEYLLNYLTGISSVTRG